MVQVLEVKQGIRGSEIHAESIRGMPKRAAIMPKRWKANRSLKGYVRLYKELLRVELEINRIMKECSGRTLCFLRYGRCSEEPYASGCDPNAEDWQIVLSDFYSEQANNLLKKREEILKHLYATASRFYKYRGKVQILSSRFPHFRQPWFYDTYRVKCPNCGDSFVTRKRWYQPLRCKFCKFLISPRWECGKEVDVLVDNNHHDFCPRCRTEFNYSENDVGKLIRCRDCKLPMRLKQA
jgi:hypothetical protein